MSEIGWRDVTKVAGDRRMVGLADQLYRAIGSVGANLAEGYSRGTGKDRARFYEYALGSARESRDWYYKARHVLGESVTDHRLRLLTQILRLLLTMIAQQPGHTLRESSPDYHASPSESQPFQQAELSSLLAHIPLPD